MHQEISHHQEPAPESLIALNLCDHLIKKRTLEDYGSFVPPETLCQVESQAKPLQGKGVLRVNAASRGGGVAEMDPYFGALLRDLGIEFHWQTMASYYGEEKGWNPPAEFFDITAGMHYCLQGERPWKVYPSEGKPRPREEKDLDLYLGVNFPFAQKMLEAQKILREADVVIVDDPQCAAVIEYAKREDQVWIWRFHPFGDPESPAWKFLAPFILQYDAVVSTLPEYLPEFIRKEIRVEQIFPFVDPFHEKLQELEPQKAKAILAEFGIDPQKPILAQASRFDPDKDPLGVIEVFQILREKYPDLQLVYTGPFANDNPTSVMILQKMEKRVAQFGFEIGKDAFFLHTETKKPRPFYYQELAALWRNPDTFVVQLSTKEGFGMVVAEAAWCQKPVVATRVGGIPSQIKDGKTGFLVEPQDYQQAATEKIIWLMENRQQAQEMGKAAHQYIAKNFLITNNLLAWLELINSLF